MCASCVREGLPAYMDRFHHLRLAPRPGTSSSFAQPAPKQWQLQRIAETKNKVGKDDSFVSDEEDEMESEEEEDENESEDNLSSAAEGDESDDESLLSSSNQQQQQQHVRTAQVLPPWMKISTINCQKLSFNQLLENLS